MIPRVFLFLVLLCAAVSAQEAEPAPSPASSPVGAEAAAPPAQPPVKSVSGARAWLLKLKTGGLVVIVQVLLSVVAGGYAVGCLARIKKSQIVPDGLAAKATALFKEGKFGELEALAQTQPSTLARGISFMATHRDNSIADISTMTGDLASGEIARHLGRAYPIAVIANLEPLLGLLGTIFGMIECFDVVAVAGEMGDASLLATGISQALVTTAVGLVLAIPLLYIYHHFKSVANNSGTELERQITRLTAEWFMKKPTP